jgi:hypothetical protein
MDIDHATCSLEAWADDLCETHKGVYRRLGRRDPEFELLPALETYDRDGAGHVIAMPWRSFAERQVVLMAARRFLRRIGATRYAIWSEAWTIARTLTPGQPHPQELPSEQSDRLEIVMTCAVARGCDPVVRNQTIVRRNGCVVGLLMREAPTNRSSIGGPLLTLLANDGDA